MSSDPSGDDPITVVGIDASAGGLGALREAERTRRLTLLAEAATTLLRGPATPDSLTALFDEMSEFLGLEIHERFEIDDERPARTEDQLRDMNRTLESRVREATSELRENEAQLRTLASDLVRAEHEERRRIADMLHDDVQQLLFGAQMRLELLREDVADGRLADLDAHVDETERYITESIDKTRHLTVELAPPSLDEDDLVETIRSLVSQMRDVHGLDVELAIESPLRVRERTIRVVVHQTLRELLFNVVKHADVRRATVEVTIHDGELDLHVSDGGRGFDPDKVFQDPSPAGLGLATLRQRLSLVGGSLSIESIPGDGTQVRVKVPTEPRRQAARG